ncbi:MAG: hypothetical protein GY821_12490, partial [Gammaproteobacteria bacterium]|nr:hypothetical protein [Gammaproteobacteria bacterium]
MKVNPIVRSIVNPIVNNIVRNVSRYFQVYNGTSSKGEFAAPKVFTGDFTASIDFATTETAVTQILIGDNDSSDHFLSLQADGEVRASINGTLATSSGIIDPRDGNLNNLTLQRVGGVFDLRLNNNSVASGNEAGDFVVSATGVYNTNLLPLKGTPANLILVDGNDRERIVNGGFDTDLSNWSI